MQTPALQASVWVQALPSEQVLVLSSVNTQAPVDVLQLSSVQALESLQVFRLLPTQTPALQVSVWVQALPSEQVFVLSLANTHAPVDVLHESSVQSFESLQTTGLLPTQTPAVQASVCVQALPSEQVLVLSFK